MAKISASDNFRQIHFSLNFILKLAFTVVWIFGLGVVESCTSSRSFGDYRVIKKTDSDTDRVVVSLEEDTRSETSSEYIVACYLVK